MKKHRPYLATFPANGVCHIAPSADEFTSNLEPMLNNLSQQCAQVEVKPLKEVIEKLDGPKIIPIFHVKSPIIHMQEEIEKGRLSDIVVKVHNREFQCHSLILHIYAKRLRPYLLRHVININSDQLTPRRFSLAYQWMISKNGILDPADIGDLVIAGNFLDSPQLIEQCWLTLDGRVFNEFAAFDVIYQSRHTDGLSYMNEQLASRISKSFLTIASSLEFLELNESQMCALLDSDNLAVNSEAEVLYSGLLWLNHQWPMRRSSVGPVLGSIRYGYLAPTVLSKFKTNERFKIGPFGHILEIFSAMPEMPKLVQDGLFFSSLVITTYNDPRFFVESVYNSNLDMVAPRRWMWDSRCSYHRPILKTCPNMRYLNYEDFINYLTKLQNVKIDFDSGMQFAEPLNIHDWSNEFTRSSSVLSLDLYKKHVENYGKPVIPNSSDNIKELELQKTEHWTQVLVSGNKWHTNSEQSEESLNMSEIIDLLSKNVKESEPNSMTQSSDTSLKDDPNTELALEESSQQDTSEEKNDTSPTTSD